RGAARGDHDARAAGRAARSARAGRQLLPRRHRRGQPGRAGARGRGAALAGAAARRRRRRRLLLPLVRVDLRPPQGADRGPDAAVPVAGHAQTVKPLRLQTKAVLGLLAIATAPLVASVVLVRQVALVAQSVAVGEAERLEASLEKARDAYVEAI